MIKHSTVSIRMLEWISESNIYTCNRHTHTKRRKKT